LIHPEIKPPNNFHHLRDTTRDWDRKVFSLLSMPCPVPNDLIALRHQSDAAARSLQPDFRQKVCRPQRRQHTSVNRVGLDRA
jgi:hypothetical protein